MISKLLEGKDWLAQCQDNVTEPLLGSHCWEAITAKPVLGSQCVYLVGLKQRAKPASKASVRILRESNDNSSIGHHGTMPVYTSLASD